MEGFSKNHETEDSERVENIHNKTMLDRLSTEALKVIKCKSSIWSEREFIRAANLDIENLVM